jgi:hypothetical protein
MQCQSASAEQWPQVCIAASQLTARRAFQVDNTPEARAMDLSSPDTLLERPHCAHWHIECEQACDGAGDIQRCLDGKRSQVLVRSAGAVSGVAYSRDMVTA